MLATEDIGSDETILTVPSKLVFSTKICYYGGIREVFYDNPDVFGKHVSDGEDNILTSFVMYELGKGTKSYWYPMFEMWPKDSDILMNWDFEDVEWLQDPTLEGDANEQY